MFILLGEFSHTGSPELAGYLRKHHFGRMWARDNVNLMYDGELWGFDNGAWSAFAKQQPWNADKFKRRLEVARERVTTPHSCVVAACPDIVAGGLESLRFSMQWIDWCNDNYPELPWFLCVQDGMDSRSVKHVIHNFRGLFLGGSDKFKTTAKRWCDIAHHEGKMFHWGRCRSINNVREARRIGADSIDSARPVRAFVMGEKPRALKWINVAAGLDDQHDFLGVDDGATANCN